MFMFFRCSLALTHHLGLPTVGFWGMQFASGEATLTTASLPPSYAPNLMSKLTDRMTLLQRTYNFVLYLVNQGMVRVNSLMISIAIQRHIPDTPSPTTLLAELNGMLINSDHIMDYPQLLPPTFIRVGGLHIRDLKQIPEVSFTFWRDYSDTKSRPLIKLFRIKGTWPMDAKLWWPRSSHFCRRIYNEH